MFNNFLSENRAVCDNVEKHATARQATDDNIIRRMRVACWMIKAIDTYCFSKATVVTRTILGAKLYVLTLPVLLIFEIHSIPSFGYLIPDYSKYVFGNTV
jgi:hypothetical protein